MVTWGVTVAGVEGDGLDVEIEAADWAAQPTARPALDDDDRTATASVDVRANTPVSGSTTRLTIPATTARLHGEGTIRLADHSFPLSHRLSCPLSSVPDRGVRASDPCSDVPLRLHGPVRSMRDRPTGVTVTPSARRSSSGSRGLQRSSDPAGQI